MTVAQPGLQGIAYRGGVRSGRRSGRMLAAWIGLALPLILVCIYLHLPVFAYTIDKSLLPKFFYVGFVALLLPVLLTRLNAFVAYLTSPFVLWGGALLILNFMHLASNDDS